MNNEGLNQFVNNISQEDKKIANIKNMFSYVIKKLEEKNASDIYFQQELPPVIRAKQGNVEYLDYKKLTQEDIQMILELILEPSIYGKKFSEIKAGREIDLIVTIESKRFRANITSFYSNERLGIYLRYIKDEIPALEKLGIPNTELFIEKIKNISGGLILICGPTGSGKSTTLASIIEYININYNRHIITLEDPIEYLFRSKRSVITQKQVLTDTDSFTHGLREALREDPDIIMVGEMRDTETILIALQASETGHTVFATLHTSSVAQTVERIVNAFPDAKQQEIRVSLALALKAIVVQRLVPTINGSRCLACEIAFNDKTIENNILRNQINQIENTLFLGRKQGMLLLNHHLIELIKDGMISPEVALAYTYKPEDLLNELKNTYGTFEL
ncbi:MAG: PilT/PilU family type 4a pilus ATPase [Sulfolobaceae archaeon]